MSDRRARKKQETRAKIVAAATRLFAEGGFEATTMGAIAKAADVGVGTLYNYFRAKERVLLGVFEAQTETQLELGRPVVEAPGDDAVAAVCRLLDAYLPMVEAFDKPVMREMFAASLRQPPEALEEFASLDAKLAGQIGELLMALVAKGAVSAEVEIEHASVALYGAFVLPVLLFLSMPDVDFEVLRRMVEGQVRTIFTGLRPR